MHVVRDDDSSNHVNDEVRADGGHHEPLIAHYEEHQVVHLEPLAGAVLKGHDETGSDVARIEEIIRIMVNYNQ